MHQLSASPRSTPSRCWRNSETQQAASWTLFPARTPFLSIFSTKMNARASSPPAPPAFLLSPPPLFLLFRSRLSLRWSPRLLAPEAAQLQLRLALGEWQGLTDTEEKGMRYAHMCSEVFCMDVQPIQDFMLSREFDTGAPFLARLLAILDRDAPLYVVPIQNFCKITSSLIKHRRKEVQLSPSRGTPTSLWRLYHSVFFTFFRVQTFEALKNHPGFVKRLVVHAAGSSPRVAELLGQFMEYESVDPLGVVEVPRLDRKTRNQSGQ